MCFFTLPVPVFASTVPISCPPFSIDKASLLEKRGYVVLPNDIFSDPKHKRELLAEAADFPEFQPGTTKFVMGGFSALANPASFHNPTVRKFRQWAMSIVVERLFARLVCRAGVPYGLEQYVGRMTVRVRGETPTRESWHRDVCPTAKGTDQVFGGWVNLDDVPQRFSCVPGSQLTSATSNTGSAAIDKSQAADCKARAVLVTIPPGHILVFSESIIHEVLSKRATAPTMVRLHLGWRLTVDTGGAMGSELKNVIESQGVPRIKSGQMPPMYGSNHFTLWMDKVEKWSRESVVDRCLEEVTYRTGKRAGQKFVVVERYMKSLLEYNLPMYPPYTDHETEMHLPRTSWMLLEPGSDTVTRRVDLV